MDEFYFNTDPATKYRCTFIEGSYEELRKPAKAKDNESKVWPDQHGTERSLATRFLESRVLNIPVMIEGDTERDFMLNHQAFQDWIQNAGYFELKVTRLNRVFKLLYSDVSNYKDFYDHCTFTLILLDDFPQLVRNINAL